MKTTQRQDTRNRVTGLCTRCHRTGAVEVVGLVCDRFGASAQPTGVCAECSTRSSPRRT